MKATLALALTALPLGLLLLGTGSREVDSALQPRPPQVRGERPKPRSRAAANDAAETRGVARSSAQPDVTIAPTSEQRGLLRVAVVDEGGDAVADVAAQLRLADGAELRSRSDGDGRIELRARVPDQAQLVLGGGDWERRVLRVAALDPQQPSDLGQIALRPATTLTGSARGPGGQPLRDVRVELLPASASLRTRLGRHARIPGEIVCERVATTDARGHFEFDDLPAGRYRISALHRSWPALSGAAVQLPRPAGEPLTLRFERGLPVLGHLVDERGRPVAGGRVALVPLDRLDCPTATRAALERFGHASDASGGFCLPGHAASGAEERVLVASAPGRLLRAVDLEDPLEGQRIVLPEACELSGILIDAGGLPCPLTAVALSREASMGTSLRGAIFPTAASTDGAGRFVFAGVPPGPATLQVAGLLGSASRNLLLGSGATTVELRLDGDLRPTSARVCVEVVDDRGAPIPGVQVELWPTSKDAGERGAAGLDPPRWTDRSGSAAWNVPAGHYALAARRLDLERTPERVELQVESSGTHRVRLTLDTTAVLRIRVRRDGAAVPGAEVGSAPADQPGRLLYRLHAAVGGPRTDPRGRAVWLAPPGDAFVFATAGGGAPRAVRRDLLAGSNEISLELSGAALRTTVTDPWGRPLSAVSARLIPASFCDARGLAQTVRFEPAPRLERTTARFCLGEARTTSDVRGQLDFGDVVAGTYRLQLEHHRFEPLEVELDVVGGDSLDLDLGRIPLAPSCSVSGRLSGLPVSDSRSAADLMASLEHESGDWVDACSLSSTGGFRFDGLEPGEYRLAIQVADQRRSFPLQITSRSNNVVELDWPSHTDG